MELPMLVVTQVQVSAQLLPDSAFSMLVVGVAVQQAVFMVLVLLAVVMAEQHLLFCLEPLEPQTLEAAAVQVKRVLAQAVLELLSFVTLQHNQHQLQQQATLR
jgi:hypothetical protein